MTTDKPEQQAAPAGCARCGDGPLRRVTSIPRRFDQRTGFTIFHCASCGHLQWEPQSNDPPAPP